MGTHSTDWPRMLADTELDELDRFLRARADDDSLMLDGVHGLLTALAIGPTAIAPDEWLPQVLSQPFTDAEEGERVLALLAQLNDSIPVELSMDAYQPILGELDPTQVMGDPDVPVLTAAGWCEGFSRGIDLRAALWEKRLAEDPQLMELLGPIMALAVDEGVLSADFDIEHLSDDEYDECLSQVPYVLGAVANYWRVRAPSASERRVAAQKRRFGPTPRSRDGHWLH
ncbi:MAG TPA: YecA family protein [Rhodanobacteraceae bacterium]|nr:YecA family protein [Rhodanobacteraceae bacterium]